MGPQTPLNGNPDPVDPPNQILKVALSIGDYFRIVSYFCDAVRWERKQIVSVQSSISLQIWFPSKFTYSANTLLRCTLFILDNYIGHMPSPMDFHSDLAAVPDRLS